MKNFIDDEISWKEISYFVLSFAYGMIVLGGFLILLHLVEFRHINDLLLAYLWNSVSQLLYAFGVALVAFGLALIYCVVVCVGFVQLKAFVAAELHRVGPARPGCFCKSCIRSIEKGKWPVPKNTGTR
jgi:protein-S-isoprenylcysteine O-methyltransferase Ste14